MNRPAPLRERIKRYTSAGGDGCWLWMGAVDPNGYGRISVGGALKYAHRVAYESFVGAIPGGMQIDHLCRVKACCNPAHLEPVTPAENMRRAAAHRPVKSACLRGHPYTPENTYVHDGRRSCITCRREVHRRGRAA